MLQVGKKIVVSFLKSMMTMFGKKLKKGYLLECEGKKYINSGSVDDGGKITERSEWTLLNQFIKLKSDKDEGHVEGFVWFCWEEVFRCANLICIQTLE